MGSTGGECDFCGSRSFMPYKCSYCGGRFCPDHRLPENHHCEGLSDIRNRPRWRDYATQVRRREAQTTGPRRRERWDREEDSRSGGFPIRSPFSVRPSWYPSNGVEAMKRNMVALLIASLAAALAIRILFM